MASCSTLSCGQRGAGANERGASAANNLEEARGDPVALPRRAPRCWCANATGAPLRPLEGWPEVSTRKCGGVRAPGGARAAGAAQRTGAALPRLAAAHTRPRWPALEHSPGWHGPAPRAAPPRGPARAPRPHGCSRSGGRAAWLLTEEKRRTVLIKVGPMPRAMTQRGRDATVSKAHRHKAASGQRARPPRKTKTRRLHARPARPGAAPRRRAGGCSRARRADERRRTRQLGPPSLASPFCSPAPACMFQQGLQLCRGWITPPTAYCAGCTQTNSSVYAEPPGPGAAAQLSGHVKTAIVPLRNGCECGVVWRGEVWCGVVWCGVSAGAGCQVQRAP